MNYTCKPRDKPDISQLILRVNILEFYSKPRDKPDISQLMKMKSVRMTVIVAFCLFVSQVYVYFIIFTVMFPYIHGSLQLLTCFFLCQINK